VARPDAEANEVMYGTPGSMLVAEAMLAWTGEARWGEAWHTVAERVVVVSALGGAAGSGSVMGWPNGEIDPWADWIVGQRFRYIQVNGYYEQLGDVTTKNYPKMTLISAPRTGGAISTRSFIPHVCHDAIGVLAAVTVATACVLDGSTTQGIAVVPGDNAKTISVEHPTGEFSVEIEVDPANPQNVTSAALLRTARLLMRGDAMVPASVWAGHQAGDFSAANEPRRARQG